jgi:hypothetical protein
VRAEYLQPMGRAIFLVLADTLDSQFDDRARKAWDEVRAGPNPHSARHRAPQVHATRLVLSAAFETLV